ncbi:MAG: coproporphyrinogen III oxidase [Phycisphaerae bacterium]
MQDIGLYIHVPFCATKCGYCDFYSHAPAPGAFDPLVDALLRELETAVDGRDYRLETIFVGGGTPTLLPPRALERLFRRLADLVERDRPLEFTVEANPASLNDTKATILRACGVSRISMGAQSFHSHELRTLDRIHSPADIAPSAEIIHRAGFPHFNLDLIFGIPGQTPDSWAESIRRAVELKPDHLACYGLTYEPQTPLRERLELRLIRPVSDDFEAGLYAVGVQHLADAGFAQYEISNFAKPGAESRHNLRYWRNQPYVGLGPSAASYLAGQRWRNVPDTAEYVRRVLVGDSAGIEHERLSPLERAGETAMLQLRLLEGIDCARFQAETSFDPHLLFAEALERHRAEGLLEVTAERIALTPAGRLVGDSIIIDFLSPEAALQ